MQAANETQTKRVTIVLPEPIHELGKQLARADHRDFSGQVAALIEAEAKRNPLPPSPAREPEKEGVAA